MATMSDPREPIEAWIDEALVADVIWMRSARAIIFVSPSRDQVRAMIEAVAPLIAAPAETKLAELEIHSLTIRRALRWAWLHADTSEAADELRAAMEAVGGDGETMEAGDV
jgi:hypothetical protein